jgi:hypothetical protein
LLVIVAAHSLASSAFLLSDEFPQCKVAARAVFFNKLLKGEVKKKHNFNGWIFSCFAAHLFEQDLF